MKIWFVDANVFLRFFTRDDHGQHERAVRLFQDAESDKVVLLTGPPVLFEVAWTLRSAYRMDQEKVLDAIEAILSLSWLKLLDREPVEEAVRLARDGGQGFADAYILASARLALADGIATFNRKDFEKMGARLYPLG
jgi:predicted nucleic acid-binding protein